MTSSQTPNPFGQQPKWILSTRSTTDPLIGCVHADIREEDHALATARGWANAIVVPSAEEYPTPSRDWITRQFELFGTVIAASTTDATRRRTSYFYRKEAISWARMARREFSKSKFATLCRGCAKRYLAKYREITNNRM